MPIMQLEPDSQAINTTETIPSALQQPRDNLFTTLFPEDTADSLLKYVEGYPWTCHFYGQLNSQSNTLEHYDPTIPNLTQPFYEIKDLILQVSSPLSSNYEASTGVTTATGAALVPLGVKPNVGDVFIAQVDSGEDAIFCITSVERKTYRKSTLYDINYSLYKYLSSEKGFVSAISQRIQQTYFFNKDADNFNRDVLITPTVKEARDRLKAFMRESQEFYLSTFSMPGVGTLSIPGVENSMYDPLLVQFLGRFIDHEIKIKHPWFQYTWTDRYLSQKSIFDLLMARNPAMARVINKTYSFVSSKSLRSLGRLGTIGHTPVDFVLYPTHPDRTNDVQKFHFTTPPDNFTDEHKRATGYFVPGLYITSGSGQHAVNKPLFHELFRDDSYVVSPFFYDYLVDRSAHAEYVSFFEVLMARFILREAIDQTDLVRVAQTYYEWSSLHQLYLLPVLWLMIYVTL